MDKKTEMQKVVNGRAEVFEKFNAAREKLYNMNIGVLLDIRQSLEKDIEILENGESFWDGLTNERIKNEKKDLQQDKAMVNAICSFIDDLEYYLNSLTQ